MKKLFKNIAAASLVLGLGLGVTTSTQAADFSGERVEWLIPFKEGGGTGTWARFYAPMLAENLNGQPTLVIKNVPGGGSIKGANQFNARAKNTGFDVFGSSASTLFYYLLGDKRAKYEPTDWIPVFASPTGGVFYVTPELGIKTAADLVNIKDKELIFPSLGATSLDLVPLLALETLGMNVKPVFGMDRSSGRLAFERGEVNVDYQTSAPYLKKVTPLIEEGKAIPIMTWGSLGADGNMQRDPTFPDLPHFAEVYEMMHGKKLEGQAFDVWKTFFVAGFAAQKIMFLPKDTPADIVATWREAAVKTVQADGFDEKAAKVIGNYAQITGDQIDATVETIFSLSETDKKWIQGWLTEKYNVQF